MRGNFGWLGAIVLVASTMMFSGASAAALKLGGVHAPNSFEIQALKKFAELTSEKSDGTVTVTVYPAGQLGDERSMIDMINTGAIDMFANVADWNQHLVKDFAVLSMPFVFENLDHLKAFQASDTYAAMKEQMLTQKNVRILADNWYRLPRVLLTRERVASIDDVDGKKLRMPDIESFISTWSAFGAKPTIIPFAEAFLALKTGIVDGMEAPLSSVYAQKFYQVAPHITMTNHGLAPFNIMMNENAYQQLTPGERETLAQAALEAGNFYTSLIEEEFTQQREKMAAEGATFTDIALAPFGERARGVARDFETRGLWHAGLFEEIQGLRQ
ncbi:TRAP transporter substrate-binding protein [Nitratireductor soli]|uniref:TRAP transporter substrate-binding protein n=1 Tax=Nitratireductor soli TaxID=1670619 RepID=UPI000AE0999A|nr:TRAP transporter substrate-binding protein [Nitratireductor soli]